MFDPKSELYVGHSSDEGSHHCFIETLKHKKNDPSVIKYTTLSRALEILVKGNETGGKINSQFCRLYLYGLDNNDISEVIRIYLLTMYRKYSEIFECLKFCEGTVVL